MKKLAVIFALLGVCSVGVSYAVDATSVGPGTGVTAPSADVNPCPGSTLYVNDDGTYENGYAWSFAGMVAPYFGAWAEGFNGTGTVCGIQLKLSRLSSGPINSSVDAYVWAAAAGNPTTVIMMTPALAVSGVAVWPIISTHDLDVADGLVAGDYFVGFWGNWPGAQNHFFIASDENGAGNGSPRTNIAVGIGFPDGWQHPNVVGTFSGCLDLGIGAYLSTEIIPVQESSWGAIKHLYN